MLSYINKAAIHSTPKSFVAKLHRCILAAILVAKWRTVARFILYFKNINKTFTLSLVQNSTNLTCPCLFTEIADQVPGSFVSGIPSLVDLTTSLSFVMLYDFMFFIIHILS